jgi:hypothetical protein
MGRSGILSSTIDPLQGMLEQLRPQTQTPQRIAQATPGQSADPVAQFQQDLNRNALTRIQNNRDRLNQGELRYRETDPKKNPNWANLDAQAEIAD